MYNEINDNNVSQVFFKDLKTDKEITLIMYGDIYQYETEFYINGYFKDGDAGYHLAYLPLKTLAAFPLGAKFKNRQLTGENFLSTIKEVRINIKKKSTGFRTIGSIDKLRARFSRIPDKIGNYFGQNKKIMNQYVAVYTDSISGKTLYIPHYEIARWFYFRSSSMTRQVLSANLGGLYYEAKYTDAKEKKAELYMKHGSSNADAAEVFRFAKNGFANIMFHELGLNLSAFKNSPDNVKYDARMKIKADFPIYGELNLKVKTFSLEDGSSFVYQIIEEDSDYPFDELTVFRYGANSKKEKEAIINKKRPNKKEMEDTVSQEIPSSEYENITTVKDTFLDERRKGLEEKKIKFPPLLDPDDDNDSVAEQIVQVSGVDLELSLTDASVNGDKDKVHTSFVQTLVHDESEHFILRENNLTTFKKMILLLPEIGNDKGNPFEISANIIKHQNLPRKPKDYKGRAKWEKAKLSDGKPRQYMIAHIVCEDMNFYAIEIEREDENDTISTQIVFKNNEALLTSKLYEIIRDFVQYNGKWKIPKTINSFHMKHVGDLRGRVKRLYEKIKSKL